MIEISQAYGWTLSELMRGMSARELKVRLVHALTEKGYTFDPEKVAEIQASQARERQEAAHRRVLDAARAHWSGQGG